MQAVTQAEFDRERFAVAILDIRRFGRFNQRYGMVLGDELLRVIGRALLMRTTTGAEACRLGGDRFAIIALDPECSIRWVAPIMTEVRAAIDSWVDDRRPHLTDDRPEIVAGLADGLTADVWKHAETALTHAKSGYRDLVEFRSVDPELRVMIRSTADTGRVRAAVTDNNLHLIEQTVEPVNRPEPAWLWLRLVAAMDGEYNDGSGAHKALDWMDVDPTEARLAERWVIEQACRRLARADSQMRISVPVSAEATAARSLAQHLFPLIEKHRVPPSRLVFEVNAAAIEHQPTEFGGRPGATSRASGSARSVTRFIHEVAGVGSSVVITDFSGGWHDWNQLRQLRVGYLRPPFDLMEAAVTGDRLARRTLEWMAANAEESGVELIAPAGLGRTESEMEMDLSELGFVYRESTTKNPARERGLKVG